MSELEEALRVAATDREKNWIGGAWLEKNCQRLLRALAAEVRAQAERIKEVEGERDHHFRRAAQAEEERRIAAETSQGKLF